MDLKTQRANDARARLIAAGTVLFAQKGFGGASVREVCAEAGTSMNMIHHYFGNKEGLYNAILEQFSAEVFNVPEKIIAKPPTSKDDFASRFELFVEATLDAIISNRAVYGIIASLDKPPAALRDCTAAFARFIAVAQQSGVVSSELDTSMLSGLVLDRLTNQVKSADWIEDTLGVEHRIGP